MPAETYAQLQGRLGLNDALRQLAYTILSAENRDGSQWQPVPGIGSQTPTYGTMLAKPLGAEDLLLQVVLSLLSGQNPDGTQFGLPWGFIPTSTTIATSQSRTLVAYGDLGFVGPTVQPIVTGQSALVFFGALTSTAAAAGVAAMSVAVSGATTISASDSTSVQLTSTTGPISLSGFTDLTGLLTPGVNVFTAKYRGDGTNAATFANRYVLVVPTSK